MVARDIGYDYRCLWRGRSYGYFRSCRSASGYDCAGGYNRSGPRCHGDARCNRGSGADPLGYHPRPRRKAPGASHPDAGSDCGPGPH